TRAASLCDAKIGVVAGKTAPAHVDRVHPRGPGAAMRPTDELFDFLFVALGQELDAAVGAVFHPTSEPDAPCLPLRRSAKIDTLHAPPNVQVHLLQRHPPFS